MSVGTSLIRAIVDNGSRETFRHLRRELFTDEEQGLYDFVIDFVGRYGGLPSPQALVENGFALPPPSADPLEYHLTRITDRGVYRAYSERQSQLHEALRTNNMSDVRDIVTEIHNGMRGLAVEQDVHQLNDVMTQVWQDYLLAKASVGIRGVPLGFDILNEATGGLRPGDVATIVARPGIGKSWTVAKAALDCWNEGNSILFVSMEMTAIETVRRIIGMSSGINPDFIQKGQLSQWGEDALIGHMQTFAEDMPPFNMLVGDLSKSVDDVDALIQEYGPDAVFIDASYLLRPTESGKFRGKRWESAADVGEGIKSVALRRHKPILQTVQFNRTQKQDDEMSLDNIGGTDVIGQISSLVLGVKKGPSPHEIDQRRYKILKNRHGPDGLQFLTRFEFSPFNMDVIPEEQSRPSGGDEGEDEEWDGQQGEQPTLTEWAGA